MSEDETRQHLFKCLENVRPDMNVLMLQYLTSAKYIITSPIKADQTLLEKTYDGISPSRLVGALN